MFFYLPLHMQTKLVSIIIKTNWNMLYKQTHTHTRVTTTVVNRLQLLHTKTGVTLKTELKEQSPGLL